MEITYGIIPIETRSVTLPSKEGESLSFTWDTADIIPASYTMTAKAILDGDGNPTNNLITKPIIVLQRGIIVGTVTDASSGEAIIGATVIADDYSATSDTDGHYNITNVPAGTYTVTASAEGYQTSSQTNISVVAEETTKLNFTLVPSPTTGTIAGLVTDATTGDPIERASVTVNGVSVLTGVDGYYSVELTLGTYTVTVSANGYEDSSQTNITVVAGETTTVDFELTPAQPLDILLYAGVAAAAIIVIAGIAVYILKVRKPT